MNEQHDHGEIAPRSQAAPRSRKPPVANNSATVDPGLRAIACAMIEHRGAIGDYLDPELFVDPALDILLFLFVQGGVPATTAACCSAARAPRTTALRWIKLLEQRDLVVASDDPADKRMTRLTMTDQAIDALGRWLGEINGSARPA